jgi:DNA-binding IclR family transcriptional regulator
VLSSASNTLRALEFLVDNGEAGVSDIGRALGVTPGTAHRLVGTLVAEGFAIQNTENRKYRPGPKVLALAQRVRSGVDARAMAHRHLVALAERVRETANLGALQENRIVYLDKVLSDQPFGIEAKIGSRVPAFCTALGKAMLAGAGEPVLERYLGVMEAGQAGDESHHAPSTEALRADLTRVRRNGYAEDAGEYMPDVFCVAAAVLDADRAPIAALSISVPRSRFRANRKELQVAVKAAADSLSREIAELGVTEIA